MLQLLIQFTYVLFNKIEGGAYSNQAKDLNLKRHFSVLTLYTNFKVSNLYQRNHKLLKNPLNFQGQCWKMTKNKHVFNALKNTKFVLGTSLADIQYSSSIIFLSTMHENKTRLKDQRKPLSEYFIINLFLSRQKVLSAQMMNIMFQR